VRLAVLVAALTAIPGAGARAQQLPRTVSPRLARAALRPDTTVLAWVIARPGADLGRLAAAVSAAGGKVRRVSRFVNAVSATIPGGAIRPIAARPEVRRVQPLGVFVRPEESGHRRTDAQPRGAAPECSVRRCAGAPVPAASDTLYGPGAWAVQQLNVPILHQLGLRGAGVRIAMLDAGFNTLHPFMAGAQIVAQRDFVYGDSVVRDQPGEAQNEMSHGTATWSLIAANAPGQLFGVAPSAQFILAKTEFGPTETRVEEDNWVAAVEWAESLGVDIISSSLGYLSFDGGFTYTPAELNGDIAVTTVAADSAAARGTLVVISAGNSGPSLRTLGTPADADSALAIGATDSLANVASFSSRGPTADGRIKPELIAPGFQVPVAAPDSGLSSASGTSFAAPLVAGLAALVQGSRLGRPAIEIRRGLLDAAGFRFAPDNIHGYGIPDALRAFAFPTGLEPLGPTDSVLTAVTPTFAWDAGTPPPGAGANVFRLTVGTDPALTARIIDTTISSSSFTLPVAPRPSTRLFWSVTAISAVGARESTAVRGPFVVPAWVTLRTFSAPRGHTIRDSLPTFTWSSPGVAAPPGPFIYDVFVYPASRDPSQAVAATRGITDTTFQPLTPLERNLPFRWRVVAHLGTDSSVVTSPGTIVVIDETVPSATLLFQSFPNPFPNQAVGLTSACIWFDVNRQGTVQLEIFDLRGRRVRRLAPAAGVPPVLPAGRYGRPAGDATGTCDDRFAWDGRDEAGAFVRPGVYLYRLTTPVFRDTRRLVFLGPP
jgi:subtilisin family serine protease